MKKEEFYFEEESTIEEFEDETQDDAFVISYNVTDRPILVIDNYLKDKILGIPPIQRKNVWDLKKKSKYIDSLLRGLPTPNLFFYENKDDDGVFSNSKYLIVDGFQRVTAIKEYLNDEFSLSRIQSISECWRNKTYSKLDSKFQDRLKYSNIPITYFYQNEPNSKSSISLIFERINTGSVPLTAQEIREAVFYSEFIDNLRKFDENEIWLKLMVKKNILEKYSYDEMNSIYPKMHSDRKATILRYLLILNDYTSIINDEQISSGSLDKKLENICRKFSHNTKDENINIFKNFRKIIEYVYENFGEDVFYTPKEESGISFSIHPTLYDSLLVSITFGLEKQLQLKKDISIAEIYRKLLYATYVDVEDNPFRKKTLSSNSIEQRINKMLGILYE